MVELIPQLKHIEFPEQSKRWGLARAILSHTGVSQLRPRLDLNIAQRLLFCNVDRIKLQLFVRDVVHLLLGYSDCSLPNKLTSLRKGSALEKFALCAAQAVKGMNLEPEVATLDENDQLSEP